MNHQRFGLTRTGGGKINRMGYYAIRGRVARDCYRCDRRRCKCDDVTMRQVKREARQQWRRDIELEALLR